jgi:hypothetical protein
MSAARRGFADGAVRFRMSAVKWAMSCMGKGTSGGLFGLFLMVFTVDHGMDLVIRKIKAIFV